MTADWTRSFIGEVCEVVNGGTPKTNVPAFWDGGHQWITPAEMGKRSTPYIDETARTLSDDGLQNSSARMLPPYSVILSSRAPIGHLAINTVPMATNQGCKGLVPSARLHYKFLHYYLSSNVELLESLGTGATFKELSGGKLKEVPIPVPPLAEQQRIVGILDEAFAGIAAVKAQAEQNRRNARGVFESHLRDIFENRRMGWIDGRLRDLTTKIGSGATPLGGEGAYKQQGISLIRSLNVHDLGFRYEKLAFIDDTQADRLLNVEVQPSDVLLNITGASIARCCVVPDNVLPARVNQHVSIIRPSPSKIDAEFLHYLLISRPYKGSLLNTGEDAGSTRQALTKAQIQEFVITYPPTLNEQRSFVSEIKGLGKETQHLETLYTRKLAALDELKKSLLQRAFSGAL